MLYIWCVFGYLSTAPHHSSPAARCLYYATSWHDRINPSRPSHRHDGNHGTAHAPTISGINQTKYRRQRPGGRYFEGFVSDIRSFLHASRKDVKVARHETRISDSVVWLNAAGLGLEARMSVPTSIWGQNLGPSRSQWPKYRSRPQLSMGWVDPWVGLVWVGLGRNFAVFNGWVGSTIAKVVKFWKAYVNALKARLDKIWLHRAVKYVSCIGLGWVSQLMGWVGSGHTKWTHGKLWSRPRLFGDAVRCYFEVLLAALKTARRRDTSRPLIAYNYR